MEEIYRMMIAVGGIAAVALLIYTIHLLINRGKGVMRYAIKVEAGVLFFPTHIRLVDLPNMSVAEMERIEHFLRERFGYQLMLWEDPVSDYENVRRILKENADHNDLDGIERKAFCNGTTVHDYEPPG